jgi:hypothetical protein
LLSPFLFLMVIEALSKIICYCEWGAIIRLLNEVSEWEGHQHFSHFICRCHLDFLQGKSKSSFKFVLFVLCFEAVSDLRINLYG